MKFRFSMLELVARSSIAGGLTNEGMVGVRVWMRATGEADAKKAEFGDALAKSRAYALAIFLTTGHRSTPIKPSRDTGSMLAKWLSVPAGTFLVLLFWRQ